MAGPTADRIEALLAWANGYAGAEDESLEAFSDGSIFSTILAEVADFAEDEDEDAESPMLAVCQRLEAHFAAKGIDVELSATAAVKGDVNAIAAVAAAVLAACVQSEDPAEFIEIITSMSEAHQTELMEACQGFMSDAAGDACSQDGDGGEVSDDEGISFSRDEAEQPSAAGCDAEDDEAAAAGRAAMAAELERVARALAAAERRADDAETELAGVTEALAKHERDNRGSDAEVNTHIEAAAAAAAQLNAREHDLEEAREAMRALKAEAAHLRDDADEAARLRDEVDVLRSQAVAGSRAGRELSLLREQLEASKLAAASAEELRERNAALTQQTIELEREASKLPSVREQLDRVLGEKCSLQFEMGQVGSRAEDAETKAATLRSALEEMRDSHERIKSEMAVLRETGGGGVGGSGAASSIGGGVSEFNPEMAEKLARLEADNRQLRETLQESGEDSVKRLSSELAEQVMLRELYQRNLKEAKASVARLEAELEATAKSLGETESDRQRLASRLEDTEGKLGLAEADLAGRTKTVEQLRERLAEGASRIEKLEEQVAEAIAAAQRASEEAAEAVRAGQEAASQAVAAAQQGAAEAVAAAKQEAQQTVADVRSGCKEEMDRVEAIVQESEESLEAEKRRLLEEVASEKAAAASAAAKQVQDAQAAARAAVDAAVAERDSVREELEAYMASHAVASDDHAAAVAELTAQREGLKAELTALAGKLDCSERGNDDLTKRLSSSEERHRRMEEELTAMEARESKLRREASSLKQQVVRKAREAKADDSVRAIQDLCRQREEENAGLAQQLAHLKGLFSDYGLTPDMVTAGGPIGPEPPSGTSAGPSVAFASAHAPPRRVGKRGLSATALDSTDMAENVGAAMSRADADVAAERAKRAAAETELLSARTEAAEMKHELSVRESLLAKFESGITSLSLRYIRAADAIREGNGYLDLGKLAMLSRVGRSGIAPEVQALIDLAAGADAGAAGSTPAAPQQPSAAAPAGAATSAAVEVEVAAPAARRRVARSAAPAAASRPSFTVAADDSDDENDDDAEFRPAAEAFAAPARKPNRRAMRSGSTNVAKSTQRKSVYSSRSSSRSRAPAAAADF